MILPSDPKRVAHALSFKHADVPPLVLSLALQAGRTTGIPLPSVLCDVDAFAAAQISMHERWQHDVTVAMFFAASEAQAFGSDVVFFDNGPPNVGAPILRTPTDIDRLNPQKALEHAGIQRTLELIGKMKAGLQGRALVAGVCLGPLSAPVTLAGMEHWLDMLMLSPQLARKMIDTYRVFSISRAKAQIEAGADAIIWFEPLASKDMLPLFLSQQYVLEPLSEACSLGVPVCLHVASARAAGLGDIAKQSGVSIVSAGRFDDLQALTKELSGKAAVIGNMDGVSMANWQPRNVEHEIAELLTIAKQTPGLFLSDAHGEIPFQVDPETIDRIVSLARSR